MNASRGLTTAFAVTLLALTATSVAAQTDQQRATCNEHPLAVQVLGSGGPQAVAGRASSSYLVWVDGQARVVVDAGGGSLVRLGESGARAEDIELLAMSHLHPDHVTDLPGFLWHFATTGVQSFPSFVGPSGNDAFPSMSEFLQVLLDPRGGAFRAMSAVLDAPILDVDVAASEATAVLSTGPLDVHAQGVPHADAPSLAYRVTVGDKRIVFGSDQTGADERFVEFAGDADLLVMHLAITEDAEVGALANLHARPSRVGEVAQAANVGRLVLSHVGAMPEWHPRASDYPLSDIESSVNVVRRGYDGAITVAEDLICIPVN